MKRRLRDIGNHKGTTLVEVIIALTILGIISVTATSTFVSSMQTSNKSREQIELNAVIDTIRENLSNAVKCQSDIIGNPGKKLVTGAGLLVASQTDLKVMDGSGNYNDLYLFDVAQDAGEPTAITDYTLLKYLVTVKKQDGTEVRKFKLEINTLDFNNTVT